MKPKSNYGFLDRSIHQLAFRSHILQSLLEDIERKKYAHNYKNIVVEKPIFITGLPRSGTSILLTMLHKLPNCVSFTYRNMPFINNVALWHNWFANAQVQQAPQQRLHRDGLKFNPDSPEAFDEAFFLKAIPTQFETDRIRVLSMEDCPKKAQIAVTTQIQKLMFIHASESLSLRYLSKNNSNISRLKILSTWFSDAKIIIPFREPLMHAASMMKQHQQFQNYHQQDPFIKQYMADIGHFEFGELHRPIDFPKPLTNQQNATTNSINYWLLYWINAYGYLLDQKVGRFLRFENLCTMGSGQLHDLLSYLDLNSNESEIEVLLSMLHPATTQQTSDLIPDPELISIANNIYHQLNDASII